MHALVVTAPNSLRHQLRELSLDKLVAVTAAARPGTFTTPIVASKLALRSLAIRHQGLTAELVVLDRELGRLTLEEAPVLLISPVLVRTWLERAWWPPATILSASVPMPRSPACVACHRCPHRPGRPIDIASTAVAIASPTKHSGASSWCASRVISAPRPTSPVAPPRGMAKRDIIRCLKRYVAREVFHALLATAPALARVSA
jgi:transposase